MEKFKAVLILFLVAACESKSDRKSESVAEVKDDSEIQPPMGAVALAVEGQVLFVEKDKRMDPGCSFVYMTYFVGGSVGQCKGVTTDFEVNDDSETVWSIRSPDKKVNISAKEIDGVQWEVDGKKYYCYSFMGSTFTKGFKENIASTVYLLLKNDREKTTEVKDGDVFAIGTMDDEVCDSFFENPK